MFRKKFPWGQVAMGFVIGAAVGAIAALLLAPTTGSQLQKQIRNTAREQADNVEKLVRKVVA